MIRIQGLSKRNFVRTLAIVCISLLPFSGTLRAQAAGTITAGTTIAVRTSDSIDVQNSDGRIFSGIVDQNVLDARGNVAIPRGSDVELLVRHDAEQYALDLESVLINERRYGIQAENAAIDSTGKEGLGTNSRTGKYVGGGAVIGAIVGAIAGGGKGAAIGGGVGAAAGAGTQVLTRGKKVYVPSESLVTFRLEQELRVGVADSGFSRNGNHYHSGYGTIAGNSAAYEDGLRAGRADRGREQAFDSKNSRYKGTDLQDYQSGYERGFDESPNRAAAGNGSIRIGADHYVTWKAPAASQVYVQVDDRPRRLFATGASGSQPAPWISYGHKYVFTVEDPNGKEIARDENDLRQNRSSK
jgi:hypothetical protein